MTYIVSSAALNSTHSLTCPAAQHHNRTAWLLHTDRCVTVKNATQFEAILNLVKIGLFGLFIANYKCPKSEKWGSGRIFHWLPPSTPKSEGATLLLPLQPPLGGGQCIGPVVLYRRCTYGNTPFIRKKVGKF